jgi:hypothetical protein
MIQLSSLEKILNQGLYKGPLFLLSEDTFGWRFSFRTEPRVNHVDLPPSEDLFPFYLLSFSPPLWSQLWVSIVSVFGIAIALRTLSTANLLLVFPFHVAPRGLWEYCYLKILLFCFSWWRVYLLHALNGFPGLSFFDSSVSDFPHQFSPQLCEVSMRFVVLWSCFNHQFVLDEVLPEYSYSTYLAD